MFVKMCYLNGNEGTNVVSVYWPSAILTLLCPCDGFFHLLYVD